MRATPHRSTFAALGLATLTGCIGELDIGAKPMLDQATSAGDDEGATGDADGPGMTSSMPPGDATTEDATSSSVNGESSSGEPPSEVSPPCELGGPGPGHDPAVQWGIVCGGGMQELVQSLAIDGTGAIYVSTQVEGWIPGTVLMGDDEIPSDEPPTLLLTKLAPTGEILWNRWFRGDETWWWGGSIAVCEDRVILVASRSGPPELIDFGTGLVDGNMAVVALDLDGETQWATATGQNDDFSGGYPIGAVTCRGSDVVIHGSTAVSLAIDDVMIEADVSDVDLGYVVVLDEDGNASWGALEPTRTAAVAIGSAGELVTLGYATGAVALARYAADGTLDWRHDFPTTDSVLLTSVELDALGNITLAGTFSGELDLGLGPLVNGDPPDDPDDPFDDGFVQDGFVSHHDASGTTQWNTPLASSGFDWARIVHLAADGTPVVQWNSAAGASQIVAVDDAGSSPVAALPGTLLLNADGHPSGGLALAWSDPGGFIPFSPPLTVRTPYDFTVTRLVP